MIAPRWLTRVEVLAAIDCGVRSLERMVQSGQIESRVSKRRAPNGRRLRQYRLDSLPLVWQMKLLARQQNAPVDIEISKLTAGQLARTELATEASRPKAALTAAENELALQRYRIIEPLENFDAGQSQNLTLSDGSPVDSPARMTKYLVSTGEVTRTTLHRWLNDFRKGGLAALANRTRSDRGSSRFFAKYPKAAAVAASLYLDQRKMGAKAIYRHLRASGSQLDIPESEMPSYETVRAWLNDKRKKMAVGEFQITPAMRIMARDGLRSYEARVSPFVRRGYVDAYANQIWCSDHGIRDVRVWNDCFYDLPYGSLLRLRLTGIADFRSRKILGFTFCPEGSSMSIVTAMRTPLLQYGPPEALYVDNGEDYKKVAREICPLIGVNPQRCLPYHGQSKPIERFWRTLKEDFDILFPGYTGGKPELRPDDTVIEEARHQKLVRMDMVEQSGLRPASYYITLALVWMDEFNNYHSHTGQGMNGRTPNEVFHACPNPKQRAPFTQQELVWTLAKREPRKIYDCSIRLGKVRYVGMSPSDVASLHDMAEQQVIAAYDPNAPESAAVLTLGGELLCWVKPERLLPHSPEAREDVKEIVAQRKRLRNEVQERIQQVHQLATSTGALTGLQLLERKARSLPIAAGEFLTQRRACPRPDDTAVAPPSAADIAERALQLEEE